MTQFPVLSPEAKAIADNFFNAQMKKSVFREPNRQLMVSLYSLMPEADSQIIDVLKEYVVALKDNMSETDIRILKKEYPAVIKYCYDNKRLGGISSRRYTDYHVSHSLIDLCMSMAEPKAGSSVFVPYSGDGSFAYHVADSIIDGFECNASLWAISQILLQSQNATADIKLSATGVSSAKQYEYIFAFPPMIVGKGEKEITEVVYDLITKQLAENGELYCILPTSFCFANNRWYNLRKNLLDYSKQYSMLVVSLPPLLLPYSGVSICLLHIKKNHKDLVALMDATGDNFFARTDVSGNKEYVLKIQSIIETIKSQDEKHVWVGVSNQLTEDFSLQPSRYIIKQTLPAAKKDEQRVPLSDVIEIVPFTRNDDARSITTQNNHLKLSSDNHEVEKSGYPIIGMKELSSSYLNCDIQRESLQPSSKAESTVLTSNCLLIGYIGGKFKVGRIHGVSESAPVVLRPEIVPVRIVSDIITEDFLLRCIMSEQTEHHARMMATGVTITRLSKRDLLSIVIDIPARDRQESLLKEDTRISLTDADRKIIESHEDFRNDMHMKKHAIGQTLFNLNNWWNTLQRARKEGNGILADDATTGKINKITVSSIYDSLQKAINQLQQQINKFDRGNGLVVKRIALTEFIEDYISRKPSPLFTYDYDMIAHHASQTIPEVHIDEDKEELYVTDNIVLDEGDPIEYVDFAPEALEIIFDNIISNACCHGFNDSQEKHYIIRFELSSVGDKYVVIISNNGSAIHDQIKPSDVFVYGKTSKMGKGSKNGEIHFGIGGYEIQKLMREFGGDAEFVSNPDSDFPVSYKLTFYNTNLLYNTNLI